MKISKHPAAQPKEKRIFALNCIPHLIVVSLSTYPNRTIFFPPSEAGKRLKSRQASGQGKAMNSKEWDPVKEASASSLPPCPGLPVSTN